MKKLILLIILCFIIFNYACSSQIHLQKYEEIANKVKNVSILKVKKVESEDKYQHFKNGVKKLVSTTIIVHGEVIKHIFSNFQKDIITTRFTTIVPVKYNENGEEELTFSYMRSISGHEHNVKVGNKYIFSFASIEKNNIPQHHLRMDLLSEENRIIKILKSKQY